MATGRTISDSHGAIEQVPSSDSRGSSPCSARPTSSQFTFGQENATFTFGLLQSSHLERDGKSTSSITSSRYTPSHTSAYTSSSQEHRSSPELTPPADHAPDIPFPSVEGDTTPSSSSRGITPFSEAQTPPPSRSTGSPIFRRGSEHESVIQGFTSLRMASITPPATSQSHPGAHHSSRLPKRDSTPSIHVTPTPPAIESTDSVSQESTDSVADGIQNLHLNNGHPPSTPPRDSSRLVTGTPGVQEVIRRSPSPGRRRRSGSNVPQAIHRVEDEDPPQSLFHHRDVQGALATSKDLVSRTAIVLSSSALTQEPSSSIEKLHQKALALRDFQLPTTRIVGLVGDSGVGKSSLINSLLDQKEFARASNSGAACTCVVTEYHFHDREDFVIVPEYFSLDELREQSQRLLEDYRQYHSPQSDMLAGEREDFKTRADLAFDTFRASFRTQLDENPGVLLDHPLDQALNTMMWWTARMLPQQGEMEETFDTVSECSSRLITLTSEVEGDEQTWLWPFIKKLKVYLKAHILSRGLIIADLPGLRDLNAARQKVTERYVRQCHQIFAVARIGRAATDPGVQHVFDLARKASLSNVGIICTQSDDIKASEARHDFPAERAWIDRTQRIIDEAEQLLQSLRDELRDFDDLLDLTDEEIEDLISLQRERSETEKLIKDSKFELKRRIITLRNAKVTSDLRNIYTQHALGQSLEIFCISNIVYWDQRPISLQGAAHLRLSGILDLRRYCIGIVAKSHLQATLSYIRDEIPAFLGSIQLWIEAGSGTATAERKQQVLDAVSAIERELDELTSPVSEIGDIENTLMEKFDTQIESFMSRRITYWVAASRDASLDWHTWLHPSYKSFCSFYGSHTTRTIGRRCWNEEAISTMSSSISSPWDSFRAEILHYLSEINNFVSETLATASRATQDEDIKPAVRTLTTTLRHRKRLLLTALNSAESEFENELDSVYTDAFSPIRTAIVGQLMEPAYRAANLECGSGSHARRKTLITNGFSSRSLFEDQRRSFKDRFAGLASGLEETVKGVLEEHLAFIAVDLAILRDENAVQESERNPEFRRRLAREVERVGAEMEALMGAVEGVVGSSSSANEGGSWRDV